MVVEIKKSSTLKEHIINFNVCDGWLKLAKSSTLKELAISFIILFLFWLRLIKAQL
jgi:hypothetical protein